MITSRAGTNRTQERLRKKPQPKAQIVNSKAYQKALIDNRASWRSAVSKNRASYLSELERIKSLGATKSTRTQTSTALKIYIDTQKQIASDYKKSEPVAAAVREAANNAALQAKNAAVNKADAAFGAFIESIGYGVLIP